MGWRATSKYSEGGKGKTGQRGRRVVCLLGNRGEQSMQAAVLFRASSNRVDTQLSRVPGCASLHFAVTSHCSRAAQRFTQGSRHSRRFAWPAYRDCLPHCYCQLKPLGGQAAQLLTGGREDSRWQYP